MEVSAAQYLMTPGPALVHSPGVGDTRKNESLLKYLQIHLWPELKLRSMSEENSICLSFIDSTNETAACRCKTCQNSQLQQLRAGAVIVSLVFFFASLLN